ncbi:MAG: 23S rRNA (guanosine(2251)-2'-O)-methyltransferase RlmB [Bacteroidales bacterium]|nr:23S rRNA (guanosine(2251)-2'-O)-methyltransferase RlmB [Bacteroidales bacterium]
MESKGDMIFGVHPVLELIRSEKEIEKVFIQAGSRTMELSEIAHHCRAHQIPVQFVPVEKLNRLTRKNHQGVIAFICPIEYQSLERVIPMVFEAGRDPFVLLLDRVTDVRNFGAIARTAYAAGVDAIVIPSKGSALVNGDAMKTSAGALSYINVCRVENLKDAIDFLKASGLRVVGFTEKSHESLWKTDLTGPLCVMMGSEEDGISPALMSRLDQHLMIPMPGDIDSLNVSVATGIACFEVVRQRG